MASMQGFKKQLNKAHQKLSEKMGGAKGTELEPEFYEMEKKVHVCSKYIDEVQRLTLEFLQPNPNTRAMMSTKLTFNKIQGKSKTMIYPQPEGILADCMLKHGKDMGGDTEFGLCLIEAGEAFRQLAEIKYQLEDAVRQNFLHPLAGVQSRDIKEIAHHRKKLEGRRLDYDCKKSKGEKGGKVSDEEITAALDKFNESKELVQDAMTYFLESDVEHIQAMSQFVASQLEYHEKAATILRGAQDAMLSTKKKAEARPRSEIYPRDYKSGSLVSSNSSGPTSPLSANSAVAEKKGFVMKSRYEGQSKPVPTCRALYDFIAENPEELPMEEGDVVKLLEKVDSNWYRGELKGKVGYFPVNYAEVLISLPDD